MSDLLYADDFVLCGESEEDLRAMVGSFVEVCRRKGLKVNAGNSKVILLGEEEGLECRLPGLLYPNGFMWSVIGRPEVHGGTFC